MKSPVEQDFTKAWARLLGTTDRETMLKRSLNALQALESPLLGAYWYSIK